jgi:microcystin-dependent protein
MSDPFLSEIKMMSFNFPPKGWAMCNGQLLPINQNQALFSLLGTTYGGDGRTTFALPNLQGAAPMQWGQGPGLSNRDLGEVGGTGTVTLAESQIPSHTHQVMGGGPAETNDPGPNVILGTARGANIYAPPPGPPGLVSMSPQALTSAGGSQPHNNMQPYLTLNFCIAMQGIYPPRS